MKFIKLTSSHDGFPIYINPDNVVSAAAYPFQNKNSWEASATLTKITTTSGHQYESSILIAESIDDVVKKLEAAN